MALVRTDNDLESFGLSQDRTVGPQSRQTYSRNTEMPKEDLWLYSVVKIIFKLWIAKKSPHRVI